MNLQRSDFKILSEMFRPDNTFGIVVFDGTRGEYDVEEQYMSEKPYKSLREWLLADQSARNIITTWSETPVEKFLQSGGFVSGHAGENGTIILGDANTLEMLAGEVSDVNSGRIEGDPMDVVDEWAEANTNFVS